MSDCNLSLMPSPGSLRDRDNKFYQFLGGGARMKVLEAFLDLKVGEFLGKEGPMQSIKICKKLNIGEDENRGWKFLHLLALAGLLEETNGTMGSDDTIYGLSTEAKSLFGEDGSEGYVFRDYIACQRACADLSFVDVLHGMDLPGAVEEDDGSIGCAMFETYNEKSEVLLDGNRDLRILRDFKCIFYDTDDRTK